MSDFRRRPSFLGDKQEAILSNRPASDETISSKSRSARKALIRKMTTFEKKSELLKISEKVERDRKVATSKSCLGRRDFPLGDIFPNANLRQSSESWRFGAMLLLIWNDLLQYWPTSASIWSVFITSLFCST